MLASRICELASTAKTCEEALRRVSIASIRQATVAIASIRQATDLASFGHLQGCIVAYFC